MLKFSSLFLFLTFSQSKPKAGSPSSPLFETTWTITSANKGQHESSTAEGTHEAYEPEVYEDGGEYCMYDEELFTERTQGEPDTQPLNLYFL